LSYWRMVVKRGELYLRGGDGRKSALA